MMNLFTFGNLKVGSSTAIFNMNPSFHCPGEKLGLCSHSSYCYAKKSERLWPNVRSHRLFQENFWKVCSPEMFVLMLNQHQFKMLRFSESGDFSFQADVEKLKAIALLLPIPVWTYTCRRDLDFTSLPDNLTVNGSGFMIDNSFNAVADPSLFNGYTCPGNCDFCSVCSQKAHQNIYVKIH